jgi:monoamine oxidase
LNAISGYYNGVELERVSVLDYDAYIDTGINWRVREGYGAALLGQSAGEIVTGCAAQRIDRSEADVLRVQTSKGTLTATTVILTVSSALLAQERPGIYPAAEDKLQDASLLPLGLADKVYFSVGRPEDIGCERHVAGGLRSARTGSYYLQPLGQPVIEAYFGGAFAGELERAGAAAMTAAALEELNRALGRDACRSLEPLAQTAWAADPWSLGSYSHALPGGSAARGRLAAPLEDRIFFAGEATHPRFFSTAHGAWESGRRAADEALAALGGGCAPLASAGGS